jgi:large subunit ribosomal protein L29
MTPTGIRDMSDSELIDALGKAKTEHFNLRFQLATNQLDNNSRIGEVKKDIARILTVMGERESTTSLTAAEERA